MTSNKMANDNLTANDRAGDGPASDDLTGLAR